VSDIQPGASIVVTDASGFKHHAFATSRIEGRSRGHSFPVIWVSFERGGQSIPWPVESVELSDVD
jgi:hypothetical protein